MELKVMNCTEDRLSWEPCQFCGKAVVYIGTHCSLETRLEDSNGYIFETGFLPQLHECPLWELTAETAQVLHKQAINNVCDKLLKILPLGGGDAKRSHSIPRPAWWENLDDGIRLP